MLTRKHSFLILGGIILFYSIFAVEDVFVEKDYDDAKGVKQRLENLSVNGYDVYVRYYLLQVGVEAGFPKLVPFIESIGLLVMTFFVTAKLSKRNMSGLLAVIIVSTSNLFLFYDTSLAYDNSWTLFLLLALYFSDRWTGVIPFITAVFCKPLSLIYFASYLYPLRKKSIPFLLVGSLGAFMVMNLYDRFDPAEFVYGVLDAFYWMLSDFYMIVMIPVVMFLLVFMKRHGYKNTMIPFFFMANVIVSGGFVEGFTPMLNTAYRYVPLVVFFAVGAGVLLQNKPNFLNAKIVPPLYKIK